MAEEGDGKPSIYDEYAPLVEAMGYHPLAIDGKVPSRYVPNLGKLIPHTDWHRIEQRLTLPQPGAGIGVRCGTPEQRYVGKPFLASLDFDDDDAALAVSEKMPTSPLNKRGRRAWTSGYRANFEVPSENFFHPTEVDERGKPRMVLQILSHGRQTVIPPSIHPDTGEPYQYTNGRTYWDTPLEDLPELPREYREIIMACGYRPAEQKPERAEERINPETGEIVEDGSYWREINNRALRDLKAWVPALLPEMRQTGYRYPAYRGIAWWRNSNSKRGDDLSITGKGIVDHASGDKYTPIDLVMAANSCSAGEALCWLEEKLLPPKPDIEIDFDKILEAPPIAPDDTTETSEPDSDARDDGANGAGGGNGAIDESYPEMEKDTEVIGAMWFPDDPIPEPKPMTVPYFVPSRSEPCIGYLGGVTGGGKTFTADDLAVAIASAGMFAGQQVTERGAVVLIEMEGSSRIRLQAAIQYRGIKEVGSLPLIHIQKMPPPILYKGVISKEWKDWCVRLVRRVRWTCARRWGVPLTAIILDPLAHFSGLLDIGSFGENTAVSKALIDLALAAKCLVLIVDHYGKDTTRGLIGSIARESLAYFVLSPGDKLGGDLAKPRQLVVRKMRDGMSSICVDYRLHVWDTKAKAVADADNFDITLEEQASRTLVIEWGTEVRRCGEADEEEATALTPNQRIVLNKINELLRCPPGGLRYSAGT
jgi:hypothetical protein